MLRLHPREVMIALAIALAASALVACGGGSSHESTTTADTSVTPVHVRDTTVVEKKVDVTRDTVKKTHNKP